jgi:hypothetical protein
MSCEKTSKGKGMLTFLFFFSPSKILKQTGRCRQCALKLGKGIIKDVLETASDKDLEKMLSLSAGIVLKLKTKKLSDESRARFVTLYRRIARHLEIEPYVNSSLWKTFWRIKSTGRDKKNTIV